LDLYNITVNDDLPSTFPITVETRPTKALFDTGAALSVMSLDCYKTLKLNNLQPTHQYRVRSASGTDLRPQGITTCTLELGTLTATHDFIVCAGLTKAVILGLEFQKKYVIGTGWNRKGEMFLYQGRLQQVIISSVDVVIQPQKLTAHHTVKIPAESQLTMLAKRTGNPIPASTMYEVHPDEAFLHNHPELTTIPTIHCAEKHLARTPDLVPYFLVNITALEVTIEAGEPLGELEPIYVANNDSEINSLDNVLVDINAIIIEPAPELPENGQQLSTPVVETISRPHTSKNHPENLSDYPIEKEVEKAWHQMCSTHPQLFLDESPDEINHIAVKGQESLSNILPMTPTKSKFITSPADVTPHRKIITEDLETSPETKMKFDKLCDMYPEVFSKDKKDVGYTKLIEMPIETGDSPPVAQRPYTVALKHTKWVQEELKDLEDSNMIAKSLSPWASPIVIVPKRSAPGEPVQRRMCVDYRMLNSLLPTVLKAHSKAKGVLSLVPLPKIDELFSRLYGSLVYASLDLRSGYNHIGLTPEAQEKSAFVTAFGKWQFNRVPFGLAQAPAYFQMLINDVLSGLEYCFGYLDDILIFSKNTEEHLDHLHEVFQRLEAAGLKLKRSKCSFFKSELHYLGHLLSGKGIRPLPDKVTAIEAMPVPTNCTEVRQCLGLAGYYRKFIPSYADLTRPLAKNTRSTVDFNWTKACEAAFIFLRKSLVQHPILAYPDPDKPYVLFTDASKYAWSGVLTQECEHLNIKGEKIPTLHPIVYSSKTLQGAQERWAAMTKEAFAIYMSIKRNDHLLQGASTTVRTDHLPLKRFLLRNTKNDKVNNWAMELQQYNVTVEYIKGTKNCLADALSRLIEHGITEKETPEPEGEEFGYYTFEQLFPLKVEKSYQGWIEEIYAIDAEFETDIPKIPNHLISRPALRTAQKNDKECMKALKHLKKHPGNKQTPLFIDTETNLLSRLITDYDKRWEVIVVPKSLTPLLMHMAHNAMGHNGMSRTFHLLNRLYFWTNLKADVEKYVRNCVTCRKFNIRRQKYVQLHMAVPRMPMEWISMDLIGRFSPPSAYGFEYALTVIDMLTNYVWCIPVRTKYAEEIIQAYINNIYAVFGGSVKILSDNGTEFKNKLFTVVAKRLGIAMKIYSPPYFPQANGKIEGFHAFLKTCIGKNVSPNLEWVDVIPLACAAYNFLPNEHSKESSAFLMFGRDPMIPLNTLLEPRRRYMGNSNAILQLDAMTQLYAFTAFNTSLSREKRDKPCDLIPDTSPPFEVNEMVQLRNPVTKAFEARYEYPWRVVKLLTS
jgi:transposase InsO family protein